MLTSKQPQTEKADKRGVNAPFFPGYLVQPKLSVNAPGDQYEQEADAMADKVMRMPAGDAVQQPFFKAAVTTVNRKCQHCEEEEKLHRKESSDSDVQGGQALDNYVGSLRSSGQGLPSSTRQFFEPRFGQDFSGVRLHTDSVAAKSAQSINALAYTTGNNIVFNSGQYSPDSDSGKKLLAHELTHVVQQQGNLRNIQRLCTSSAICNAPSVPGSATSFGVSEAAVEAAARRRRKAMPPAGALSSGHGGHARQLEIFLQAQDPGRLANVNGIFIDWDMSQGTGALTQNCSDWIAEGLPPGTIPPGMAGATKPCVFVHGDLNQQALAFNTTTAANIGGQTREAWRADTLRTLTHETQHVIFDTAVHANPAGITTPTCTQAAIQPELSELSAELSEFPVMFRAIPAGAPATDPARVRLSNWFNDTITNSSEGIRGILQTIGCRCECTEVDAFVTDTFNFTAASWTAAEKTAFNTELNRAVWGMRWPVAP